MNVLESASQRWRKKRQRGVSPIIATILLVAITVVLAAVLYVLISGLTGSTASAPIALAPSVYSAGTGGSTAANTWYVPVTVDPTASISTSQFGLRISGSPAVALGAATGANCAATHAYVAGTTCTGTAANGWYAVLTNVGGTIISVYTSTGWSASGTITGGSYTINIISYGQLDGLGYTLSAFGTGSTSVSGQVFL